jgi:hypothetical protein
MVVAWSLGLGVCASRERLERDWLRFLTCVLFAGLGLVADAGPMRGRVVF